MNRDLHRLLSLAATQYGCFTRDQWRSCGLSDSRLDRSIDAGWIVAVHQRVYRVAGVTPTWHQRIRAATLIAPGRIYAGGRTALSLHGVAERHDPRPHLTIPHDLRYRFDRRDFIIHTSRTLHRDATTEADDVPTVSVDRSLLEDGMRGADRAWLDLVSEAARLRLVTPDSLGDTLETMGPIPNRRSMRSALSTLDDRFVDARSVPEVSFATLVEEVTGHSAVLNHPVADGSGHVVAHVDVAVPELRLGYEGDSVRWHGAGARQGRDRIRDYVYDDVYWTVGRIMLVWLRTDLDLARAVVRTKYELALRLAATRPASHDEPAA